MSHVARNLFLIPTFVIHMSDTPRPQHRASYIAAVNRAIDHVYAQLSGDLSLTALAEVTGFSPFHFHRIFKAITGEPLNQFIVRVRLARACFLLRNHPERSITAIAYDCGFSSPATFARAFRANKAVSAAPWRDAKLTEQRALRCAKGAATSISASVRYVDRERHDIAWNIELVGQIRIAVTVKTLPALNVAYVRHFGRYDQDIALFQRLFNELLNWAAPRGLVHFPETQALTVFGGHPTTSEQNKLRADVCLTVPSGTSVSGAIGSRTISGGCYAVVHVEAAMPDCHRVWDIVVNDWLPRQGLQSDDRDHYVKHLNDPKTHPQNLHIVDMCIPVIAR